MRGSKFLPWEGLESLDQYTATICVEKEVALGKLKASIVFPSIRTLDYSQNWTSGTWQFHEVWVYPEAELYFNNLLKLRAAILWKVPSGHTKAHRSSGPAPAGTVLSSVWWQSFPALGSALIVAGACLRILDSPAVSLFSHGDLFSVDWVEVRTLTESLILGVRVAKSLALLVCGPQFPHLWSKYSTPPLSSDILEPSWNLYSGIIWLICTNLWFTKHKWLYEAVNPGQ